LSGTVKVDGGQPNEAMSVTIVSLDASGNRVDKQTVNTAFSSTNPVANGSFRATIKAKKGGKIIITAKGSNTTEAGRVIEFKDQKSITTSLEASTVTRKTVNLSNGLIINSSGRRIVRFAFTRSGNGAPRLAPGLQAQNTSGKN